MNSSRQNVLSEVLITPRELTDVIISLEYYRNTSQEKPLHHIEKWYRLYLRHESLYCQLLLLSEGLESRGRMLRDVRDVLLECVKCSVH